MRFVLAKYSYAMDSTLDTKEEEREREVIVFVVVVVVVSSCHAVLCLLGYSGGKSQNASCSPSLCGQIGFRGCLCLGFPDGQQTAQQFGNEKAL